ncbi:Flp pilus assembly protein TadG [Rhodopirellula rubra]|uniref:Flp pilus assembly protein TadG n=1 Tax=Aporhodopirellula rubra TaxID=980271 RepID=A0A7W5DZ08_9BACT|nr:VWA domain-containing protein [Aporhodopirellula rubra]MBB3207120.1 Flp pilus assembly protein TadG [Aporhodopirellula rubra]
MPSTNPIALLPRQARAGSVTVLLVVLLPVLFMLSSYAINIAYVEAVHADVQITTDAAVQAAGRAYIQSGDENAALLAAQDAAARNPVSGKTIPIVASDLEFGSSLRTSMSTGYDFTPVSGEEEGNAVRLTTNNLRNATTPIFSPVFPTMGVDLQIRPHRTAVSTQSTMDVALVLDRSGSMAFASDEVADPYTTPAAAPADWWFGDPAPPNSRWLDVIASVQSFKNYLEASPQKEKLSVSTYSDTTSTEQILTFDYQHILDGLGQHTGQFNGGGTAIGKGLQEGLAAITDASVARPYAVKVMILLTDGIHNTGTSPESVSWSLKNAGVTLFTITFSNEAGQNRMKNLAENCGGLHFHAVDATQLTTAFEDIARRLPSLMTQ